MRFTSSRTFISSQPAWCAPSSSARNCVTERGSLVRDRRRDRWWPPPGQTHARDGRHRAGHRRRRSSMSTCRAMKNSPSCRQARRRLSISCRDRCSGVREDRIPVLFVVGGIAVHIAEADVLGRKHETACGPGWGLVHFNLVVKSKPPGRWKESAG